MSSQPIVPTPSVNVVLTQTPAPATPIRTFLKNHETLIIFVLGFVLLWFISGRVENTIAAHDAANLLSTQATLASQVEKNQATAATVAQQAADFKALADKVQTQNAALVQANTALATALSARQKTDATLTLPELEARWAQLVPNAGLSITNGQATVSDAGAHATVAQLEQVPVLTTELANEKTETASTNTLLAASNGQVVTLNGLVSGLQLQAVDKDKDCQAQIRVVKDAARKSKRRWFIIGFITGFLSRQVIKTETGF